MMISQQKFEKLNLTQKTVTAKPVRRRQRQTLSCLPCRRLKVKCDRGHPCRHCRWSERADSCRYDPFPAIHAGVVTTTTTSSSSSSSSSDEDHSSKSEASPQADSVTHKPNVVLRPKLESETSESSPAVTASSVQSEEIPTFLSNRYNAWNSKFRGSTHWLTISRQIEYGHKTLDKHPLCQVLADVFKKINENFTATMFSGNYPFGTGYQEQAPSKNGVLSFIPDHGTVMFLVNIYMNTIERTHPMLHPPTFYEELDRFWRDPASVEDGWLSQLLVMLGLSYHMSKGVNVTPDDETTLKQYFRGAETCLKATNYLICPNLTSLRVLCMMVLARRIIAGSCLEVDACGPVMAVIFRMATGIGLNVDSQYDVTDDASVFEREIRKKLWITIVLIGASISVLVGTPLDARASDIDIPLPLNLNNDELGPSQASFPISRPPTEFTDSTFSMIASQSFRLALDTLTHANSPSTRLSYEDVLECSAQVKDLLLKTTQIYGTAIMERADSWKSDQSFMLEIYLRRILLALHSVYGLQSNADIDYPISYWSTLESALALLVLQRQLAEDANSPESRLWLGEYYKHDFYAATMTICLIITRNDDLAMDINSARASQALIQLPQRETILQTLLCCRDIWARRICQTHCHFLSCLNLGSIITSLATPLPKGSNSIQVYKASFCECLRLLKNCPCGKCATDPSSVKGSFMEHPLYQTI